jgi:hypothetical protein
MGEGERVEKRSKRREVGGALKASKFFEVLSTTLQTLANKSTLSPKGVAPTELGSKTVV